MGGWIKTFEKNKEDDIERTHYSSVDSFQRFIFEKVENGKTGLIGILLHGGKVRLATFSNAVARVEAERKLIRLLGTVTTIINKEAKENPMNTLEVFEDLNFEDFEEIQEAAPEKEPKWRPEGKKSEEKIKLDSNYHIDSDGNYLPDCL